MNFEAAIKKAKENSGKRKFSQSVDLIVNLKNLDLKKPENQIRDSISLPNGKGKVQKGVLVADDNLCAIGKKEGLFVIRKVELDSLVKDRKKVRKIVKTNDYFICQADLMTNMAKALGAVLGPKNKMPQPVPQTMPTLKPIVAQMEKTVRVYVKTSPVVHCSIGVESMEDAKIAQNAQAVYEAVEHKLPKGVHQIRNAYVKLTMGKPIKVE